MCLVVLIAYLGDTSYNLKLIFQVSCHMERKNRLDISYSFPPRSQECQNKNHLIKEKALDV